MELRIYLYNKPVSDVRALHNEVFADELGAENSFDDSIDNATYVIIYDGKTAVATGRLVSSDGERFDIAGVCVKKAYRGKKRGKRVLSALEEDARKAGGKTACGVVSEDVKPFFEKAGYTADESGKAGISMVKKLR